MWHWQFGVTPIRPIPQQLIIFAITSVKNHLIDTIWSEFSAGLAHVPKPSYTLVSPFSRGVVNINESVHHCPISMSDTRLSLLHSTYLIARFRYHSRSRDHPRRSLSLNLSTASINAFHWKASGLRGLLYRGFALFSGFLWRHRILCMTSSLIWRS